MNKRKRMICKVTFRHNETNEEIDLGLAAFIVQAGCYWWVRLFSTESRGPGQWQLTPVEKIREYSDGLLG